MKDDIREYLENFYDPPKVMKKKREEIEEFERKVGKLECKVGKILGIPTSGQMQTFIVTKEEDCLLYSATPSHNWGHQIQEEFNLGKSIGGGFASVREGTLIFGATLADFGRVPEETLKKFEAEVEKAYREKGLEFDRAVSYGRWMPKEFQ